MVDGAAQQLRQPGATRSTQQVTQGPQNNTTKRSKRAQARLNNMLQGLMFLPDGRVLIMDSELYKQTIEKSIVLDLFDGTSLSTLSTQQSIQASIVI